MRITRSAITAIAFAAVAVCVGAAGPPAKRAGARAPSFTYRYSVDPSPQAFAADLTALGDVDADGVPDIVVANRSDDAVRVYSGRTHALLATLALGSEPLSLTVADLDGDGHADIVVGLPLDGFLAGNCSPSVTAYSGANLRVLYSLHDPNSANDCSAGFGFSVASADLDGDGRPELVVGSPRAEADAPGHVFVFDGESGALLHTLSEPVGSSMALFGISVAATGAGSGHNGAIAVCANPFYGADHPSGQLFIFASAGLATATVVNPPTPEAAGWFCLGVAAGGSNRGIAAVLSIDDSYHGHVSAYSLADGHYLYGLEADDNSAPDGFGIGLTVTSGPGRSEILVGSPGEPVGGTIAAGKLYDFDTRDGGLIDVLDSPKPAPGGFFGATVSAIKADGTRILAVAEGDLGYPGKVDVLDSGRKDH